MPKSTWNERYRGEGGGGYAGSISYGGLATAIRAGYATASTDTGHVGGSGAFALNADGTLNQGLIHDFARRSLHEMVLKAKALINAHYGASAEVLVLERLLHRRPPGPDGGAALPGEYDGLVIAAPAINWERFIPAETLAADRDEPDARRADPSAKLNARQQRRGLRLRRRRRRHRRRDQRSAQVRLRPGRIGLPGGRRPRAVSAAGGGRGAQDLERPARREQRHSGSGSAWSAAPRSPASPARTRSRSRRPFPLLGHAGPAFDWHTRHASRASSRTSGLSQTKFNDVIGTDEDNLQRFRKHGGKIIIWHGEADQLIFPRGTVNYYDRVLTGNGGLKHVDDFVRLFLAPGVGALRRRRGPEPRRHASKRWSTGSRTATRRRRSWPRARCRTAHAHAAAVRVPEDREVDRAGQHRRRRELRLCRRPARYRRLQDHRPRLQLRSRPGGRPSARLYLRSGGALL